MKHQFKRNDYFQLNDEKTEQVVVANGQPQGIAQSGSDWFDNQDNVMGTNGRPQGIAPTICDGLDAQSVYSRGDPLWSPVGSLLLITLERARDSEPEADTRSGQDVRSMTWGWLPLLTLLNALGVLLVAYAFTNSRDGGTGLNAFFYSGLLIIFIPVVVRLISPEASRAERIGILCVVGMFIYLIKVIASPLYFSFFDEFLHWRTVDDIVTSGHLFGQNAMLPVSPYYPGLEIVTSAFSMISGLNTFHAGLVVVGMARLLMMLTLFGLNEQLLKSSRMAGIATLIYMVNPHFLIFDSLFAYESLALPLALFVLFAIAPHQWVSTRLTHLSSVAPFVMFAKIQSKGHHLGLRWITVTGWLALGALTYTHHVTDFFLVGLLVVWTIVYGFLRLTSLFRSTLARTALLGVLLAVTWIFLRGNPVVGYISSFLANTVSELGHVITGTSGARQLFTTYNGQQTPIWERVVMAFSVVVIVSCLPFGLLCLIQRYRANALTYTLGFVSFLYPVSQVFRFTNSGAQVADRAAAFLFIPIASVLAIFIVQFWPIRHLDWKRTFLLTCTISLVFVGGVILGAGPGLSALPGPYEVAADSRSLEPEGIQAATWTHTHLGEDNRIATDRTNQMLMSTFGKQRIVTSIEDDIDVSSVFFSSRLGPDSVSLLKSAQARYLVVDLRMAQALPLNGFYFVEGEPDSYQRTAPIALEALTKFNTILQMNRVFDSGSLVIYDAGGLIGASEKP